MAKRSGSSILPLHGGRVPPWLATRMSSLGAVITQAIVHHYGRDEFLRRLSHPFWFQSFGAVMGVDWHSSGITTSVIGALKLGLGPLSDEPGIHVCGGRAGELPKGSVLLVENLDRVSRQTPRKALKQILEVIDIGIGVVTLTDNEWFTADSLDDDASGMKLFASLMVLIRANNESRVKGERVAAAWSKKRDRAREKFVPMTDRIPGWLLSTRDQTGRRMYSVDEDRADIVRRIFNETVQGLGRRAIAKGLNRDGKLSFLSETSWQPSSVIKITRARTTVGEYQPHRRDESGRRVPHGDPIKGYYPAVLDEAHLWAACLC